MKLSELGLLPPHPIHSITEILINGRPYELADDGDTLIEREMTEPDRVRMKSILHDLHNPPPVMRPCPKCEKQFSARELRIHKPKCEGKK